LYALLNRDFNAACSRMAKLGKRKRKIVLSDGEYEYSTDEEWQGLDTSAPKQVEQSTPSKDAKFWVESIPSINCADHSPKSTQAIVLNRQ
jgi:hypothetical protein